MRARPALLALLLFLFLFVLPGRVQAGGWAVATLDSLPGQIIAGEPVTIGFFVRQHGHTPVRADRMNIYARQVGSGKRLEFVATPRGEPGHYQAELVFPSPGEWKWEIESGFYPERQPMPALTILAGSQTPAPVRPTLSPLLVILAAVTFAAGALALVRNGRLRWALAVVSLAALIALVGIFSTTAWVTAAHPGERAKTQEEVGRELFVAKGCVICHNHIRAGSAAAGLSTDYGPDLSRYIADPEYLHTWLKSPSAIKPRTDMPDLGLKKEEIEALIAFINAE